MSNEPLQPGQRIGNYLLQQEVGRGAFAVVWKAVHHERPTRTVALKIATHPDYRRQLAREGRLPEIDHPNVTPILDCDTRFTDHPYIVTPFYAQGSLADLIAQHPSGLPEARVESLLKDILAGLSAAHQQGIVHRDIKPANILLDDAGRAVIADFGLSLSNGNPDAHQSLMQSLSLERETTGKLAGTLAYMAPEVLSGSEATTAADVYSVGILLFEMLTGRRPLGLELPSHARRSLHDSDRFDGLFYWACRPVSGRYQIATQMIRAVDSGTQPIQWGDRASNLTTHAHNDHTSRSQLTSHVGKYQAADTKDYHAAAQFANHSDEILYRSDELPVPKDLVYLRRLAIIISTVFICSLFLLIRSMIGWPESLGQSTLILFLILILFSLAFRGE